MTRRSRGSDKQAKARRRKAAKPKRGTAPLLRRRSSSAVGKEGDRDRRRAAGDQFVGPARRDVARGGNVCFWG